MEGGKEVKIRISMLYVNVVDAVLAIVFIAMSSMPVTFFEPSNNLLYDMAWSLAFLFITAIFIGRTLWGHQTATLDENGIAIRSVMGKIVGIEWINIVKADIQSLVTLTSRAGDFDVIWIVLYTANDQEPKDGYRNKKNKPPWKIIYNRKNAETINDFLKRYSKIRSKIKIHRDLK